MKQRFSEQTLPLISSIGGCIGFLLQFALLRMKDANALLPEAHPLHIATVILSIAAAALVLICLRRPTHTQANPKAAFGAFFAGLWMLLASFNFLEQAAGRLDIVRAALSFLCVPCLLLIAWRHFKGSKPSFWTNCILCLFFIVNMLCQYPQWCANPQTATYLFPLLACVFLSLAAYQRTAFDWQGSNRKKLLFCCSMAVFFCLCSMAGSGNGQFYLAAALWAMASLNGAPQEEPHVSA